MTSYASAKTKDGPPTVPGSYRSVKASDGSPQSGPYYGSTSKPYRSQVTGQVMAPPYDEAHSLLVKHQKVNVLRVSGVAPAGTLNYIYDRYNKAQWTNYAYASAPTAVDWNWLKSKALAQINPFRPAVDIPLFLFEFKDFPRMLRDLGHVLQGRIRPKDIPGGHLAYNFGWAPLISDLSKLIKIAELIERQKELLQDAQRVGGRKVRKILMSPTYPTTYGEYTAISLSGGQFILRTEIKQKLKAWCTARIYLTSSIPEGSLNLEAFKAVIGANFSASTIWNAIPWSWLIDYFVNFGLILEARRGYDRWEFKDLILMATSSKVEKITGVIQPYGTLTFSGGIRSQTKKERKLPTSNPNLSPVLTPMLNSGQIAILSSLAVASVLRRLR